MLNNYSIRFAVLGCLLNFYYASAIAQVIVDGSLNGAPIQLAGPEFNIGSELGRTEGRNLFHSFETFSINTGETATFSGPASIANIVSRVTGSERSSIDGLIRSTISGANFFLLNPNGIAFGPNASLDVDGSFHASTADFIRLEDNSVINTSLSKPSVFTSAPPAAFGFLDANQPAQISVSGEAGNNVNLRVPTGKSVSLIGGDIALSGADLIAPAGQINLFSIASGGAFELNNPSADLDTASEFGNVTLSGASNLDVSNIDAASAGGSIVIRSGQFHSDNSTLLSLSGDGNGGLTDVQVRNATSLANGSAIFSVALGSGRGSDIAIDSGSLAISDNSTIFTGSDGAGNGISGNIAITTDQLTIQNNDAGGIIASFTTTPGDAGDIFIHAGQITAVNNGNSIIDNAAFDSTGNGGDIFITADQFINIDRGNASLNTGIVANTRAAGNAGTITITAPEFTNSGVLIQALANSNATGNAGNIDIDVNTLQLSNNSQVDVRTGGPGLGGNVSVTAETISIVGDFADDGTPILSGVFSNTLGTGDAGSITIDADVLAIGPSGRVTVGDTETGLSTTGPGNAGSMTLNIGQLVLDQGVISSATSNTGLGGDILINADQIQLQNGARISANSLSNSIDPRPGNAGSITISAGQSIFLDNNSTISSTSNQAGGGSIAVDAADSVVLRNSAITTEVLGEAGSNAGDIHIGAGLPLTFIVLDNSNIIANAIAGPGNGGAITLSSEQILRSTDSIISASAGPAGIDGTIQISSPDTDVSSGITVLPAEFFDASTILNQGCAARGAENVGRLVIEGRGGLPITPDATFAASNAVRLSCNP